MRKLLLASAAMLGAASGGAMAQVPTPAASNMMMQPAQGQMALPWQQGPAANNNNNAYGMPSTYSGGVGFPANVKPTPGTVVIRLNGKVEFDANLIYTSFSKTTGAPGAPVYKVNPVSFSGYMRLYPGVDGMATNGLRYGASVELRQNIGTATTLGTSAVTPTAGGASVTAYTTTGGTAVSASSVSSAETVFVRRAFTYLALDNVGILRMGTTDGVIGLFDNCIFSGQCYDAGMGNLNGGDTQSNSPANTTIPFVWLAQAGAEYDNVKIVYLSPQFFGLDFGFQYAPSMGNGFATTTAAQPGGPGQCGIAGPNCIGLTTGTDGTRWYNQVGVGARYQGKFGPVSFGVYGFYETAGKEVVTAAAATRSGAAATNGGVSNNGGRVAGNLYDNLSFISAATFVTVDTPIGQITGAFDYIGGAINGQLNMRPTGGASMQAFLPSVTYRNGPLTLGAQFGTITSQGAVQLTGVSQRREMEIAVGGSYLLAPGVYVSAEYLYEQRHQGGFDFASGASAAGTVTRDSRGHGFTVSTTVNW